MSEKKTCETWHIYNEMVAKRNRLELLLCKYKKEDNLKGQIHTMKKLNKHLRKMTKLVEGM